MPAPTSNTPIGTSEFLRAKKNTPSREVVYFSEKANGGRQRNSNIQQQQGRTQTQLGPRGLSSVIKTKILDDTANMRWTTRSFNCQNKPRTTIDLEAKELCKHHRRRYTATLGNAVSRVAVVIIVI
ncbi:uncharacterized protein CEXT_473131 [Caerostris extrusa]|uniref:Uncharacterized protein n=1 Tax=Caerostris extrusa TaxID=172846 RepID=A0AAV4NJK2_CAEEX|nr:uncharacterized protein CEXT_473131 [Caerostris extrusa]